MNNDVYGIQSAFTGIAGAIQQKCGLESGDYEIYRRKTIKHVNGGNVNKVMLYLAIYYSFHEVSSPKSADSPRSKFPEAFEFLNKNGIKARGFVNHTGDEEEKYCQIGFFKTEGEILRISHYPNGYDHYFGD